MPVTIFVVDDDESFRRSVIRLLCAIGYEAREFASVAELPAETIGSGDCLLVDHRPNGRSTFDLLVDRGINAPTVLMSGRDRDAVTIASGTRPFLIKPFNQTQLMQAIEAVTGSHSAVK
jgi:two-component system, LuxR family, response regulator FixJ